MLQEGTRGRTAWKGTGPEDGGADGRRERRMGSGTANRADRLGRAEARESRAAKAGRLAPSTPIVATPTLLIPIASTAHQGMSAAAAGVAESTLKAASSWHSWRGIWAWGTGRAPERGESRGICPGLFHLQFVFGCIVQAEPPSLVPQRDGVGLFFRRCESVLQFRFRRRSCAPAKETLPGRQRRPRPMRPASP